MQGVDEDTKKFHEKGKMGAIFGDETFKQWVFDELMPKLAAEGKSRVIQPNLTMPIIVEGVVAFYNTTPAALLKCTRGPQHNNEPRKVAMYLSQELAAARLVEIADYFNLNHYGSVGFATCQIRQRKKADRQFALKLTELIKGLIKSNS
jgi:putative transposase